MDYKPLPTNSPPRVLCLSNGHGEDGIAVRLALALKTQLNPLDLQALPLVGEGYAYRQAQIPLIGRAQAMPSGGFIYMDGRQLARDLRGGLVGLTWSQIQAVRDWARLGGAVLAVGDIVPLLFAWASGAAYAFVGTAKSEYYLRDEAGLLPRETWWERWEGWGGSVYLPWERWLMASGRCRAVFPRDALTARVLQRWAYPVFNLGNPMMDDVAGLAPAEPTELTVLLLPGSRPLEAQANWRLLVQAATQVTSQRAPAPLRFLAPIAPLLPLAPLEEALIAGGWNRERPGEFRYRQARLCLDQQSFPVFLRQAHLAIALAGTATEQFAGLGKPVITFPGPGPQFTARFARAQARLLGPSVTLVAGLEAVAPALEDLLHDPDRLQLVATNGPRRLGPPGASQRIAACFKSQVFP